MSAAYLSALVQSWRTFDWRAHEAWLNTHPQFVVAIGDADIHFAHLPSSRADAPALLVMHGWPHTFALQLDFAKLLPDFHVVVPSIPGFAFSSPYRDGTIDERRLASTMHRLMTEVLGYRSYSPTARTSRRTSTTSSRRGILRSWPVSSRRTRTSRRQPSVPSSPIPTNARSSRASRRIMMSTARTVMRRRPGPTPWRQRPPVLRGSRPGRSDRSGGGSGRGLHPASRRRLPRVPRPLLLPGSPHVRAARGRRPLHGRGGTRRHGRTRAVFRSGARPALSIAVVGERVSMADSGHRTVGRFARRDEGVLAG
jgi:hypothetical protein